jgi:hypothetical protein
MKNQLTFYLSLFITEHFHKKQLIISHIKDKWDIPSKKDFLKK